MKCFQCGKKCITKYHERLDRNGVEQIIAVSKVCELENGCGWSSYPTKIPEAI